MPLLRDWNGTNGPLAKRQVRGNIRHLATGYYSCAGFWKRSPPRLKFLVRGEVPPADPNRQLLCFAVGLTACAIEPLADLGNVIVDSVQQIASRDWTHPQYGLVSC